MPISDNQFLATILLKVWKGDQITDEAEARLRLLAQDGRSDAARNDLEHPAQGLEA
jgi:hypothetical protein